MCDKAGRDKLDALSWALYNKQRREGVHLATLLLSTG
nr:MAG TPA: Photosystem II protein Y (PsbY) [Caudoviricetes sp.]